MKNTMFNSEYLTPETVELFDRALWALATEYEEKHNRDGWGPAGEIGYKLAEVIEQSKLFNLGE